MIAEDPKSEEIIKPILRGRDIKRYHINWAELWLIATLPSLHLDIENYPAIKRHLLTYGKAKLEQAGKKLPDGSKSRKRTPHAWFELQDTCAYHAEFYQEKIVYPETMRRAKHLDNGFPRVSLDLYGEFITDKTAFILTGENLRYIVALLNSKLMRFLIPLYVYSWDDSGFLMQKIFVERLPIPKITAAEQPPFIHIVDSILQAKAANPEVNTRAAEAEIDQLVYQLYNLTDEEISLVES